MRRTLIEWTVFGVVMASMAFLVHWLVPWAEVRYDIAMGKLKPAPQRLHPVLRQHLREEEDRLARAALSTVHGLYRTLPCLVFHVREGVGAAPEQGVSTWPTSKPSQPANPFHSCLELVPGGPPANAAELSLKTGDAMFVQTDLYLPGDPPIAFTRVVQRSVDWNSKYQVYLPDEYLTYPTGHRNPYTDMTVWLADRSGVLFNRVSKGTGYADAIYKHTATRSLFYNALVGWNGNGWDYDLPDGRTLVFPDSYYAQRPQEGALVGLIAPSGARLDLDRDRQGNLHEVRSSDGRWIKLHYRGPLVVSVKDSAGDKAVYSYDKRNRLSLSTNAAGKTLSYAYNTSGGLERVENVKTQQRVLSVQYAGSGFPSSMQVDGGPVFRFSPELEVRDDRGHQWVVDCGKFAANGCEHKIQPE